MLDGMATNYDCRSPVHLDSRLGDGNNNHRARSGNGHLGLSLTCALFWSFASLSVAAFF